MEHSNTAFKNEKGIIKSSSNKAKRDLRTTRGLLYHKLGESTKGIIDLEDALKLNSKNSLAMLNLRIIYSDMGNHKKSCKFLSKASELEYEKEFDRNDIEYYKKISCSNEKIEKPFFDYCQSAYIDLNLEHNRVKVKNYPNPSFEYELCTFKNEIIANGIAIDGVVRVEFLPPGLDILKITNKEQPLSFRLLKL
jgi:tetratricopeptide (TPR) repeat protein